MNKLFLFLLLVSTGKLACSQTAVDFTATDCAGNSHNLFTELNAGKIIVLVWVMPCGTCISDAKAGYDAVQSFATSNPGKVVYWLVDDFGNSSCTTLSSWASTNGILPAKSTIFGNAGIKIDENNYGGSGMPHVVVLAGGNHKIYYNKKNGSNDGVAIMQAVAQVLINGISTTTVLDTKANVFPNPAKNKISVDCSNLNSSISLLEIYNILGEKIQTIAEEDFIFTNGVLEIYLPGNLPIGNYLLKLRSNEEYQSFRFTIVE